MFRYDFLRFHLDALKIKQKEKTPCNRLWWLACTLTIVRSPYHSYVHGLCFFATCDYRFQIIFLPHVVRCRFYLYLCSFSTCWVWLDGSRYFLTAIYIWSVMVGTLFHPILVYPYHTTLSFLDVLNHFDYLINIPHSVCCLVTAVLDIICGVSSEVSSHSPSCYSCLQVQPRFFPAKVWLCPRRTDSCLLIHHKMQ